MTTARPTSEPNAKPPITHTRKARQPNGEPQTGLRNNAASREQETSSSENAYQALAGLTSATVMK